MGEGGGPGPLSPDVPARGQVRYARLVQAGCAVLNRCFWEFTDGHWSQDTADTAQWETRAAEQEQDTAAPAWL